MRAPSAAMWTEDRGSVAVQWTVWWMYWGARRGKEDDVVGVVEGAWVAWGLYTGDTGVPTAVLRSVWWEYWGRAAVLGSSMMGVSGDARRYLGVTLTPQITQGGHWGILSPGKETRGTVPAGTYIA